MKHKKLLLAGGGYAEIPLIKAAQALGYYVITTGNRPEDLGHQKSDKYCPADFSDLDQMLKLAKYLNIHAICPSTNDFLAISCSYVAEILNLSGHDSYETCKRLHHKDSYRQFASENNIPTPKAQGFSSAHSALAALDTFRLPVLVKPVDLTGGKGIGKIDNPIEAPEAVNSALNWSKAKRIVVEEFITGSRHGFSALIKNGKVTFYFLDNEHYYLNPYLVAAASTPGTVPGSAVQSLIAQAEKIASLLNLNTGIFHVQYILHKDQPIIIEICRQPPGDLYIKLVEHATGVDYSAWIINAFAGSEITFSQSPPTGFYTRHCIMAATNGTLLDVTIDKAIQGKIIDSFMWWKKGQLICDYRKEKFGIVFLKFKSISEMLDITENLPSLIKVRVKA